MLGSRHGALSNILPSLNTFRHSRRRLFSLNGGEKPYYVTTPIFYPNAAPHIGHLHSVVIADIFARYARLQRPDRTVHFMTGTDEHGLKIQKAAKEKGMSPIAFCDEISEHFRNLTKRANISHTKFSRTTEPAHILSVQHLWSQLDAKGLIYKGKHEGWYSISDECFYTDTQVTRVVPDVPLMEAYHVSTETGSRVEWTEEENYKFRLSSFQDSLRTHFEQHPNAIHPSQYHSEVLATLASPLSDLSISRPRSRLTWGVPVPNDVEHTIYVWIDALTVYLSAAGYPWGPLEIGHEQGWPPNLQVIGKDILRFHAIYFPAMLQALNLPLTTQLLTHSHWTVDQRKMSKSVGNVADPFQAIQEFGIDIVRYYLARVGGKFKDDVDWSHVQLGKHAREITSLLGNLNLRVTSKRLQDRVSGQKRLSVLDLARSTEKDDPLYALMASTQSLSSKVQHYMNGLLVQESVEEILNVLEKANVAMTAMAPWDAATDVNAAVAVRVASLEALRVCGILLQPFIPSKAEKLLDALGVPPDRRWIAFAELGKGDIGTVTPGVKLFEIRQ